MSRRPIADAHDEAMALLTEAESRDISLRAVGGLAIHLNCPSASRPPLQRAYKDIDLVGLSRERAQIEEMLSDLGYAADAQFNLLSANGQLYFRDEANGRQLDIFLDRMQMCHRLDLEDRLALVPLTLTPTDLLLSKLQVVETNERDLKDAAALLLDCEIEDGVVAERLAADWGWWRTVTEVLDKVETFVGGLELQERDRLLVRIAALRDRIEAEPKGRKWKLRARVGDRVQWYDLPEDDHAD